MHYRDRILTAHLFLGHLHNDHKEDLPHLLAMLGKDSVVNVYMSKSYVKKYEKTFGVKVTREFVTSYPHFPVHPDNLPAKFNLHFIDKPVMIGEAEITPHLVKHMEGGTIFKVEKNEKTFIYGSDVAEVFTQSKRARKICSNANLIVWDSLYTREEINDHNKNVHSSIESVIDMAVDSRVKELVHFHHSPLRNDTSLTELKLLSLCYAKNRVFVHFAKDGMKITV